MEDSANLYALSALTLKSHGLKRVWAQKQYTLGENFQNINNESFLAFQSKDSKRKFILIFIRVKSRHGSITNTVYFCLTMITKAILLLGMWYGDDSSTHL
jgi:hypothetical protein